MRRGSLIATAGFFLVFVCGALFRIFVVFAVDVGTAVTATPARTILTQSAYRWYENIDALTPTTDLAPENTAVGTPVAGATVRLRMNVLDSSLQLGTGETFNLQYSNSTSSGWTDVESGAAWIFGDNASVADGQNIVTTALNTSDTGETYNESSPTQGTPNAILPTERGEWDWVIQNNSAAQGSDWFFRMVYASSTALDVYDAYPRLSATSTASSPATSTPSLPPSGNFGNTGSPAVHPPLPPIKPTPSPVPAAIVDRVDLNGDRKIDMRDFSILLFYFGRVGIDFGPSDFNGDNKVTMADVSILLYYWTV